MATRKKPKKAKVELCKNCFGTGTVWAKGKKGPLPRLCPVCRGTCKAGNQLPR